MSRPGKCSVSRINKTLGAISSIFLRLDPNDPCDHKEAYDLMDIFNEKRPWPSVDFRKIARNFYNRSEKLALTVLDLISFGLNLEVL